MAVGGSLRRSGDRFGYPRVAVSFRRLFYASHRRRSCMPRGRIVVAPWAREHDRVGCRRVVASIDLCFATSSAMRVTTSGCRWAVSA